ncbi:hypothetical protein B0H14DRAFT_3674252 [Mycena olivaceomarginata]|nr:hypothetical protein B0H14DRAFT_3674252 [Mycena olivaceomarginata]
MHRAINVLFGRVYELLNHHLYELISLLDEIRCHLEAISGINTISHLVHLNSNERTLQRIKSQVDDAYRDLMAASALRVEVQSTKIAVRQAQLSVQQAQTQLDVTRISVTTCRGIWAWDSCNKELVPVIPSVLSILGDNPMQSEFACHIGFRGRFFCRVCWVKGAPDEDEDEDGEENNVSDGFSASETESSP